VRSLYDPRFEHDACGVGFLVQTGATRARPVLAMALTALARLAHRGAVAADGRSGDGAGVMTQVPRRLLLAEARANEWPLTENDRFGVAMLFLAPDNPGPAQLLAELIRQQGLAVAGWRRVPIDADALGDSARATLPDIRQLIVRAPAEMSEEVLERRLYLARKQFEREATSGYICSLSCRTIVYKALCSGGHLAELYVDLRDPAYETDFAVFHQRYSTNTLPTWQLAQPFRLLAHNGEINTLWANRAWLRAREAELPFELQPLFREEGSDSATLDEALELLTRNGRELDHALSMLIIPAWDALAYETPGLDAFFRYHAPLMEPWDGPAALAFSDGLVIGAALDRNGLRPCRYSICEDGLIAAGSEVGLFDIDDDRVVEKGRLGPGQMLLIDVLTGRVLHNAQVRERHAKRQPYESWLAARLLLPHADLATTTAPDVGLDELHHFFGFTVEDLKFVLAPMADDGKEPAWSMGDDTPIPPLARSPRSIYTFLRERFAQVTNPPIDPLREACVMSLRTSLGPRPPLLSDGPQQPVVELASPVLSRAQLSGLLAVTELRIATIACTYDPERDSLPEALDRICGAAEHAVRDGAQLLHITDRNATAAQAPLPMALAIGALHYHLLRSGLRARVGLLAEAGDCFDVHHLAVLLGYGAAAVCPWLALSTARLMQPADGEARLIQVYELGLRKVLSKMGISAAASYRSGQFFEVLGLADEIVERCFAGTPSRIGGLDWTSLQASLASRHRMAVAAVSAQSKLPDHGLVRFRRGAEFHHWQPATVRTLQRAVGAGRGSADADAAAWDEFRAQSAGETPGTLRGLLDFVTAGPSLSLADIEPAESIVKRFVVSAMSLGALSPEAHNTLTIAMNRLGARSNTGEGGEDPLLYESSGERTDSKIKQVASGRFGVTALYLARAEELEIKIAQGSKPGEGGQLPGAKVTELIARLRHAQVGQALISPPPHHDIYSIEDLAQLIYDLKRCNPRALVGVKLVAEAGVGTIAAGVAKARADYVAISGHSGGTGASPLSSIKHAGAPWELGLAETHQVLVRNGLRATVRVRVDGGLMTATDVLMAALLGADEFGFGTAPLIALGCDMARQCHLNTCPTGIATQQPGLRAKFRGTPEQVMRFFMLLAEDVRGLLSMLGVRSLPEAVGRVDLLRQVRFDAGLDLTPLLAQLSTPDAVMAIAETVNDGEAIDDALLHGVLPAIDKGNCYSARLPIRNCDRAVGARIAGELALRAGAAGFNRTVVDLRFQGSAGQSFGAFCCSGMRLRLTGEANDYVGKGLCGGELVLRPAGAARAAPSHNVIMGNVALYGATSGRLFAAGVAGERFAVRNSGATAIVEGVGDHGCEYMTGGVIVVLGETGVNFGAGMTGGLAFVWDPGNALPARLNDQSVLCTRAGPEDSEVLFALIEEHVDRTRSIGAEYLMLHWGDVREQFWKVEPRPLVPVAAPAPAAVPQVEPQATA
jgi:glutamate synthase (NADPH/NADH) large chain